MSPQKMSRHHDTMTMIITRHLHTYTLRLTLWSKGSPVSLLSPVRVSYNVTRSIFGHMGIPRKAVSFSKEPIPLPLEKLRGPRENSAMSQEDFTSINLRSTWG